MKNNFYEIRVDGIFESAHYLYDYLGPGENEPLHGHTYEVELFIQNRGLKNGISIDFLDVRKYFDKLLETFDHTCLNAHPPFNETNPTAENIAFYIYEQILPHIPEPARISRVTVWEGPKNHATYYP